LTYLGPHPDARYVAVSPDGSYVASGSHNYTGVKVWDARTGRQVRELCPSQQHAPVFFSPDGRWLGAAGIVGVCRLWEVETWKDGLSVPGTMMAFSPDNHLLAVETGTGAVRLLDPASGREYARLELPDQVRTSWIAFSPDGARLATSGGDQGAVHVWDLREVRKGLAGLELDWDLPAYQPPPAPVPASSRIEVVTDLEAPPRVAAEVVASSLALSVNPLNPDGYYRRALALALLGRVPEALADATVAAALRPVHPPVHYLRHQLLRRLGRGREARDELKIAIGQEPNPAPAPTDLEAYLGLDQPVVGSYGLAVRALLYGPAQHRAPGLALLFADRARLLPPGIWSGLFAQGAASYRLGHVRQAVGYFRAALRTAGAEPDAWSLYFLAMCYHRLGDSGRARDCFAHAGRCAPTHGLTPGMAPRIAELRAEAAALLGMPATPPDRAL
jgi:tetratricopeptide (TPR) repeat protein